MNISRRIKNLERDLSLNLIAKEKFPHIIDGGTVCEDYERGLTDLHIQQIVNDLRTIYDNCKWYNYRQKCLIKRALKRRGLW
ncbi:hypothetical protein J4221_02920 [Candidatus Pacearchaeota archaeon]|nr:hypothetical protein [Candidatus Pacearchaeota archaeon]